MPRLIEAPKLRLKEVQRWILRAILDHVPVHEAATGFARTWVASLNPARGEKLKRRFAAIDWSR